MFALNYRRLYRAIDHVVVRNLRSRKIPNNLGPNPGLDKRITAFRKEGHQITDDNVEDFVEQSESDFYKVGDTYTEHMNETLIGKHELRHHIVKEKYFKENMPNLLTWSEKEQIRHLATTQPNEWPPERIAESFPVTVPVVKKLLRYPWKPATEQRIARHDASAVRNWKELKEGSLTVPEELRKHLLKFSDRTIPPLNKKSIKIDITQSEKMGEFERIVQRCAEKAESNQNLNEEDLSNAQTQDIKNTRKDRKLITLDELKSKIKKRLEGGNDVDTNDQLILSTEDTNITQISSTELSKEIELQNENKEITEHKNIESEMTPAITYPERIRIPKKAYKRGATYKVNDCYYDHDGRFLYRVLGMSN